MVLKHTSNRAFKRVNGFNRKPTAVRVVAPASKLPPTVKEGRTDEFDTLLGEVLRTSAKWGDTAIHVRSWVRLVKYMATPGTFLYFFISMRLRDLTGI